VSGDIIGSALDGGDCVIGLELDSAGGTSLGDITIANTSAAGTVDELDLSSVAAARGLTSSNLIMVEVDGHASTTAAILPGFNIYLFFEPDK